MSHYVTEVAMFWHLHQTSTTRLEVPHEMHEVRSAIDAASKASSASRPLSMKKVWLGIIFIQNLVILYMVYSRFKLKISSPPTPIVIEEHFATDAPPPPAFATAAALEVVATTTTTTATGQLSPTAAKSIMTTLAPRKKTSKSAKIIVGKLQTARNNPIPNNEHPHFSLETVEKVEGVVRPPKHVAGPDILHKIYHTNGIMAGTELIVVASVTHLDASKNARVTVELTGEDTDQRFLHADARLWGDHQLLVCNTRKLAGADWGNEESKDISGITVGSKLIVRVVVETDSYVVYLNDRKAHTFKMRSNSPNEVSQIRYMNVITSLDIINIGIPPSFKLTDAVAGAHHPAQGSPTTYVNHNLLKEGVIYDMFVGILSTASNFDQRWAVRQSWFNYPQFKENKVRARFFIAQIDDEEIMRTAVAENQLYDDIVFMPHKDGYRTIAMKTLGICKFAARLQVKFVLKCDDDSFPRLPRLMQLLGQRDPDQPLYLGSISHGATPWRSPSDKWYMPYSDYPGSVYPPFAHGPGYILSRALLKVIMKDYKEGQLKVLPLEDVTMAVWVNHVKNVDKVNVNYENDHRFSACCCDNNMMNGHYIESDRMLRIFSRDIAGQAVIC